MVQLSENEEIVSVINDGYNMDIDNVHNGMLVLKKNNVHPERN